MWAATHGLVMLRQAGMLHDAPDFAALASFQGALMLKGAGAIGGFSGRNSIGLRAEVLSRHLDLALDAFVDCLTAPALGEAEIEIERRQVLEDIRVADDNVSSAVFRLLGETLWTRRGGNGARGRQGVRRSREPAEGQCPGRRHRRDPAGRRDP